MTAQMNMAGGTEIAASAGARAWSARVGVGVAAVVCVLCWVVVVAFAPGVAFASSGSGLAGLLTSGGPLFVEPPVIRGELYEEHVYSTRAQIIPQVEAFKAEARYRASYSESPTGPWTLANEGSLIAAGGDLPMSIGLDDATFESGNGDGCRVLHHLGPGKTYYARFEVTTAGGEASRTFPFTTKPVAAPEIPLACRQNTAAAEIFKLTENPSRTGATFAAQVETNGLPSEYFFEYTTEPSNPGSWKPFTSGATATVSVAEDYADPVASVSGLAPETEYHARLRVRNAQGSNESERVFTTEPDRPRASADEIRNVTESSARVAGSLDPEGSKTEWRFEVAESPSGPWSAVPGASGTISQEVAEETPEATGPYVFASLSGLSSSKRYYVRLFAKNGAGEGKNGFGEPILTETRDLGEFETVGPPEAVTSGVHALDGESVRLLGEAISKSGALSAEQEISFSATPTGGTFTLTFDGHTTGALAYNSDEQTIRNALEELPEGPSVSVGGFPGGPYSVYFYGSDAAEPLITGDGSGLQPSGTSVNLASVVQGGAAVATTSHFEYVPRSQYEQSGFAGAASTSEVEIVSRYVGQDVPGLQAGQTYMYRLVAGGVQGPVQSLTVPTPAAVSGPSTCANAAQRTGASAALPDCRAYEQITPVDKEGAQELFNYGPTANSGALVGEEVVGEETQHLLVQDPVVNWGTGATDGQSPYLFTRSIKEWGMLAGSAQPQTGVDQITPVLFNGDVAQTAVEVDTGTAGENQSADTEFEVGPIGGPYTRVVSVPRTDLAGSPGHADGWVAASRDFSKLILASEDRELAGTPSGTLSGADLYEYTGRGESLALVNGGVGTCGAHVVSGGEPRGVLSSSNAVSASGSRVFFEAVPGSECSQPSHLYIREDGSRTIDLGAYTFAGSNPEGGEVLLERRNGPQSEYFVDKDLGEPGAIKKIFSQEPAGDGVIASPDLSIVYFRSDDGAVYGYNTATEQLSYLFHAEELEPGEPTPDGRFLYFHGTVSGVPGKSQMFLYDSEQNMLECASCASSFDPEPRLGAYIPYHEAGDLGPLQQQNGWPARTFVTSNGDYAFFDTPAALAKGDIDGEVAPDSEPGAEDQSGEYSTSSDVYEWRRNGIGGCEQLRGCLALITNGRGGFLNLLIGATPSGGDVFIYTVSQLTSTDTDSAGDIYDARIEGGYPPASEGPVECEGEQCSKPANAPDDQTPGSATLSGNGNIQPNTAGTVTKTKTSKPKKTIKPKKKRKKSKGKRRKQTKSHRGHGAPKGRGRSLAVRPHISLHAAGLASLRGPWSVRSWRSAWARSQVVCCPPPRARRSARNR